MEELQQAAFAIISIVGEAKASYMKALNLAKAGKAKEVEEEIRKGNKTLAQAHHEHFGMIQREAEGHTLEYFLLFTHAEDQLLTAEVFRDIAAELLEVYKELKKLKGEN